MQDGAEVAGKGVGGSLERVKHTTLNLHALTAHTLAEMDDQCQVKALSALCCNLHALSEL